MPQLDKIGFGYGPTVEIPHEDAFVTELPYESLENGNFHRVPLIIGTTTLETALFSDGKFAMVIPFPSTSCSPFLIVISSSCVLQQFCPFPFHYFIFFILGNHLGTRNSPFEDNNI